ncbi:unnamed protein product [Caenorhabditis auriculariae]|uniref:Uncharacterized protein n=1 Tax=Caenorhabditis auriculariae TaxID=2777116 RepID=A0A8S1HFQ0_9PELO|nr:unnamed protein product [Caenorhabditis auriculariae]
MSVESLFSEVSSILGARLAIAAADELHFGGKRVFSDVSAAASTSSIQQKSGGKVEGGKKDKGGNPLLSAIDNAKHIVGQALAGVGGASHDEITDLQKGQKKLESEVEKLTKLVASLQTELASLKQSSGGKSAPVAASAPAPADEKKEEAAEGDDDFDLFGSDDEEDEEKKKIVEERLKAYAEKKSKKPGPIAKSSVILDVKPWDDETNMQEMEDLVRGIEMDGLVWGGGKLIPIGYGIKKLQIICVIEDLKVSVDDLIEKITGDFENHVQSVDIAAFNKI